jgi:uncharacterized repeat protein (TIGR01451 family)
MSLSLNNTGPQTARAIQLQNRLPNGMVFEGSSLSSVSHDNGVVTVSVDSLGSGQTAIYSYQLKATTNGLFWNAAQVVATTTQDPDSQPGSGTGDGQDDMAKIDLRIGDINTAPYESPNPDQVPLPSVQSSQPPTDPAKADLSLALAASSLVVTPDQPISLTLTATNRGGAAATNVMLQCQLPPNWLVTNLGELTLTGQTVTGPSATILAGASATLILSVQPLGNGLVQAQVLTASPSDSDSTPGNGFTKGEDDEAALYLRLK